MGIHGSKRMFFSVMVASMCCDCDELPFPSNYISIINICRRQVSGANGGHIFREYENYNLINIIYYKRFKVL